MVHATEMATRMALDGRSDPSRSAIEATTAAARQREFRRARRHSWFVRGLRVMLPIGTLAALASYGLVVQNTMRIETADGKGSLSLGTPVITTENLTMRNPRYEGFGDDGSSYFVTADAAVQDFKSNAPIRLDAISGRLTQADKSQTVLTAKRGFFDQSKNTLDLFERIDVKTDSGMTARLTQAKVAIKDARITSTQPVEIDTPTAQIRANGMSIKQKTREIAFTNGVATRLTPPSRPATAVPDADPAAASATPGLLGAAQQGPIDIASRQLDIDDEKKTATFRGDVVARQGAAEIQAPALIVLYQSDEAEDAGAAGKSTRSGGGGGPFSTAGEGGGRLKQVIARDNVRITQNGDVITARTATFDAASEQAVLEGSVALVGQGGERTANAERLDLDSRAETALLTGDVVVTQAQNVLKGQRLEINRKSARSRLSAPGLNNKPAGRISARLVQAGRAQAANASANIKGGKAGAPAAALPTAAMSTTVTPATAGAPGFTFRTDPNAPVDIEATVLDVDDNRRTATFTGDVNVVQGEFTLRTVELIATYSGQAGLGTAAGMPSLAATAKGKATGGAGSAGQATELQRIQAKRKVVVTSGPDQSASGDWADFDVKSNLVTIGGDVVLTQGRQIIRGPKLVIDVNTGLSRMETKDASTGTPTGERMRAVFYPKDAQDAQKKQQQGQPPGAATAPAGAPAAALAPAGASAPAAAPPTGSSGRRPATAQSASPWGTSTFPSSGN